MYPLLRDKVRLCGASIRGWGALQQVGDFRLSYRIVWRRTGCQQWQGVHVHTRRAASSQIGP